MSPPPATFSWSETLRALRCPGPPPPGLVGTAFVLLVFCLATVVVLLWLGHAWHGDAHRYFGERKAGTYLSFINLAAAGVMAGLVGRRLEGASFARFWWAAAVGFAWLGLDDLFVLHERIDRGMHALLGLDPDDPLTDHLDDAIVAAYGVAALALGYRYRTELASLRWMVLVLGAAFPLFAAMVNIDFFHLSRALEDSLKAVAGTLILMGFVAGFLETRAPALAPAAALPAVPGGAG